MKAPGSLQWWRCGGPPYPRIPKGYTTYVKAPGSLQWWSCGGPPYPRIQKHIYSNKKIKKSRSGQPIFFLTIFSFHKICGGPLVLEVPGCGGPWLWRSLVVEDPWLWRSLVLEVPGCGGPWLWRSLVLEVPGFRGPWLWRSLVVEVPCLVLNLATVLTE